MKTELHRIDQCLFGYEDGHRLLASSIKLGDQTSTLTQLSDLIPGASFSAQDGYWTGLPLGKLGRYALLRTWPAPEMPRPGCVWTHALLFHPALFDEFQDLSFLQRLARRPNAPSERSPYSLPIELQADDKAIGEARSPVAAEQISALLEALYGGGDNTIATRRPGGLDESLFAVWSQQWPRLRRNLRFQTAVTRDRAASGKDKLDLTIVFGDPAPGISEVFDLEPRWRRAAREDLLSPAPDGLRAFLWKYGADVRRQRGSFRPLCQIKLLHDAPDESAGQTLLSLLMEAFSEPDDAVTLKQDIVDGLVVPEAQLEVLWLIVANADHLMPTPSAEGVARLAKLWPARQMELLHLAERAAAQEDALSTSIFSTVANTIPIDEFWAATAAYPRMRERMVATRPELILAGDALGLDNEDIASLIALLAPDSSVAEQLIPRLFSRDDIRLADLIFDRFPKTAATQVLTAADGGSLPMARAWMRTLVRRPAMLLDAEVMKCVTRTSILYELADELGWLKSNVVEAGAEPWFAALVGAEADLSDDRRNTLRAFLVALALAAPGDAARRLLEWFFAPVHAEVLASRLPWRARDILDPLLPDLGWQKNWDFGLRMRLAVTWSFVTNDYAPEGYALLATDRKSRELLADAGGQIKGGKRYVKALFQ